MSSLSTYGSTVFKFDRAGKKWKELGSGFVSFTLKDDRLVISVNSLTFYVQGGVRQKGPKAVVMRVRDDSLSKGDNIILAVRFERERDARNLFTLLASTQWIRPRHRGRKHRRREPPAFFMSMGTREQENIRALVSNAEKEYIEDHTIQRQLAVIYKMTPLQIEEAINFFQPWLRRGTTPGGKRGAHPRAPSLSVTRTESSLPSIRTSKLTKARKSPSFPTPAGSNRPGGSLRAHAPSNIIAPQLELGAGASGQIEVEGKQNKAEIAASPELHLESNEAKEEPKQRAPKNSSPTKEEIPLENNLAPHAGNVKGKSNATKRIDHPEADERTSSMRRYEYSTPPTSSPGRSVSANRGVCQLTMQNLMLHNKMVPQLKRDTHEKVTLWLKEFQRE